MQNTTRKRTRGSAQPRPPALGLPRRLSAPPARGPARPGPAPPRAGRARPPLPATPRRPERTFDSRHGRTSRQPRGTGEARAGNRKCRAEAETLSGKGEGHAPPLPGRPRVAYTWREHKPCGCSPAPSRAREAPRLRRPLAPRHVRGGASPRAPRVPARTPPPEQRVTAPGAAMAGIALRLLFLLCAAAGPALGWDRPGETRGDRRGSARPQPPLPPLLARWRLLEARQRAVLPV